MGNEPSVRCAHDARSESFPPPQPLPQTQYLTPQRIPLIQQFKHEAKVFDLDVEVTVQAVGFFDAQHRRSGEAPVLRTGPLGMRDALFDALDDELRAAVPRARLLKRLTMDVMRCLFMDALNGF